jgi:hypothetical protein
VKAFFNLETRKGNTGDSFELEASRTIGDIVMITYFQISGRVEPNTNTVARYYWVAVSTKHRIAAGKEPLYSEIVAETTIPNPHD